MSTPKENATPPEVAPSPGGSASLADRPAGGTGDIKRSAVRGATATLLGQGATFALAFGSAAALGRLLEPADFGLVAMVSAVTGFVVMFRDAGLSQATVQQATIDHRQVSTLFWLNVALTLAVTAAVVALSPLIAWFYGEPRLAGITVVSGLAVLVGGLGLQHRALLLRSMRAGTVSLIGVAGTAVGVAAGVTMAALDFGYWSLIGLNLATALATTIGFWIASGWRPGPPVRRSGVRRMAAFGGWIGGGQFVNYFARNADNVLIGRFLGEGPLGHYSRAYALLLLPLRGINGPLNGVAVPGLSRLQDEPRRYAAFFLRALWLSAVAGLPIAGVLIVLARPAVRLVLGDGWETAERVFEVLAWTAPLQVVGQNFGWLYVAGGQTRRLFAWSLIGTPIVVGSFAAGLPFGVVGVAASYALAGLLYWPLHAWHATRGQPVTLPAVARTLLGPTLALLAQLAAGLAVTRLAPDAWPEALAAAASLAAMAVAYLTVLLSPRANRDRLRSTLRELRPARK